MNDDAMAFVMMDVTFKSSQPSLNYLGVRTLLQMLICGDCKLVYHIKR